MPKFDIEDIVYFKLDKEQNPMIIISYWVKSDGIQYQCRRSSNSVDYYYDFELTSEQNILTKIS